MFPCSCRLHSKTHNILGGNFWECRRELCTLRWPSSVELHKPCHSLVSCDLILMHTCQTTQYVKKDVSQVLIQYDKILEKKFQDFSRTCQGSSSYRNGNNKRKNSCIINKITWLINCSRSSKYRYIIQIHFSNVLPRDVSINVSGIIYKPWTANINNCST